MGTRILTTILAVCSLWISSAQAQNGGFQTNNRGVIVNAVVVAPVVETTSLYLSTTHFETVTEASQAAAERAAWSRINGPDTYDYQNLNARPQTELILRRVSEKPIELKQTAYSESATTYNLPIGCELYLLTGMGPGGWFTVYVPSVKTKGFVHQNDLRTEIVR